MGHSKKIRHIVEYGALRVTAVLIQALPVRAASVLAEGIGDVVWVLGRKRRRVACANILKAGVTSDPAAARKIGRAASRHVGAILVESWKMMPDLDSGLWADRFECDIAPETRKLLDDPTAGVIFVSAHLGNWELGAGVVSGMKPLHAVIRNMNNPYVNEFVARRTHRNRMRTLPRNSPSARPLLKALKRGEGLGLLVDQHARIGGIVVDFLGHPASTHTSPARLHLASGAPVVITTFIRTGRMRYHLTLSAPVVVETSGDRDEVVRKLAVRINERLGEWILRYPEQYLWAHRRWR